MAKQTQPSAAENFRNVALGIAGIASSILIPALGLYYTSRDKEREVSKGFVEIATKILSDKPTEENKPLREWATDLIDNYSAVKLSEEARSALLESQPIFENAVPGSVSSRRLDQLHAGGVTLGVTLSQFNRDPDFAALKQHNIEFAYIRVSQGATGRDSKGSANVQAARQAGLKVGLFHFFRPNDDPDAQFANFSSQLDAIPWDLPPVIDCEEIGNQGIPPGYGTNVLRLATQLESRLGVKPIIYTTQRMAPAHFDKGIARFPLFIAQFNAAAQSKPVIPAPWTDYVFWHMAAGVNDDPLLRLNDIVAFKGSAAELSTLSAGPK